METPDKVSLIAAQTWWKKSGIYAGEIDGQWGPISAAAERKTPWLKAAQAYWTDRGWYRTTIDGEWGSFSALARAAHAAELDSQSLSAPVAPSEPAWIAVARKEIGTHEIAGGKDNPRIVEYASATSLSATDDETAWCSSFVNWVFKQLGMKRTDNAMARSWLTWGTKLGGPKVGAVVVFSRGAPPSGHVGFVVGWTASTIATLGGNQSDSVKISNQDRSKVLGYRWPA